ncbi:MAG: aspartyl protease family protein [Bacteroidota bacterium]
MLKGILTFLFVAQLTTAAWSQQVLGFSLVDGKTKVQMPIEIHNNLVVLPVVLNGQLPLKFILDTGVRTAILTEKTFSDILNLTYSRKLVIGGPGGEKIAEAYITNNVSFDLPGVHGDGHSLLVLNQDYLELRNFLGTDVHGVLGYELFSRFIVKIDYDKKMLTLMLPERFHPSRRYKALPITIEDTKPYVHAKVQVSDTSKVDVKLLVDSGASHGLILEPDSARNIHTPKNHIKSIIGRGLGGVITGKIARVQSLELDHYNIERVIANFPDENSYRDTLKTSRTIARNGTLGGEILSRFTVIFSFPQEKIYLKKNPSYKKRFYYNLSGLTLKAKGARLRKYEIADVRENSAAAKAGLLVGDNVIAINGMPATDLDLNNVNSLFNNRPGKKVTIEIERKGEIIKKKFRLENQI